MLVQAVGAAVSGTAIEPDADVIVVGAGLGGSCAAWQLSEHGLSVLVLEGGPGGVFPRAPLSQRIKERLDEARGRPPQADRPYYAFYTRSREKGRLRPVPVRLGRVLGGTSTLYAAALGRLKRSDFAPPDPRSAEAGALPTGWPIDYDSFLPYYRRAEALMRVRGERDPGDADDDGDLLPPPPLGSGSEEIRRTLIWNGHLPYRLHVAIDYVAGCRECFGYRCALACKADGYNRALDRAVASGIVAVEPACEVVRIERPANGRVRVIVAGPDGREDVRTGRRLILAAGALNSPLLLCRSPGLWENREPPAALGRGLMFHVSDLFILAGDSSNASGPQKWLGLRDFYGDGLVNLGEVQSLGVAVSTGSMLQGLRFRVGRRLGAPVQAMAEFARPLAWIAVRIIGPRPIYATITEDLPNLANRVSLEDGRIVATYATAPALVARTRSMRASLRAGFAPFKVRFLSEPGTPNWGHPLGTCRMGRDPATSVVDPDGRLHGHPTISVADASSFPTSGGTGPSLTVIALALRTADRLARELSAPHRTRSGRRAEAQPADFRPG